MAIDFPTTDPTPGNSNRLLTPEEIAECEQMKIHILAQCDQILSGTSPGDVIESTND